MKLFFYSVICLLTGLGAFAGNGGGTKASSKASAAKVSTNGTVSMKFNNIAQADAQKDSVLIIFDRFDRTGAGVVYQVFYADNDQNITIPEVPAGKYYVTIQCLGLHHDRMEKVVTVKSQKDEQVKISIAAVEEFSKDKVVIPATPNPQDFASFRSK